MKVKGKYLRDSKKYDVPLFCGKWVKSTSALPDESDITDGEELVIFGGGGGDPKHGIKNRLIIASYNFKVAELSDEICHISTGDDPPFQIAVHPSGDSIIAAFSTSCKLFHIQFDKKKEVIIQSERSLQALENVKEQKCLCFSVDGTKILAGDESGNLCVFEWPSMKVLMTRVDAHNSGIKDGHFSLDGSLVVSTSDDGSARVWDVSKEQIVTTLSSSPGSRFGLCKFSHDSSKPSLLTTLIKGGNGFLVRWNPISNDWKKGKVKLVHKCPISCIAIAPNSSVIATGTAEGDIAILNANDLSIRQHVKSAHMIFVTSVSFSHDSRAVLSVSGDSSARVTLVPPKQGGTQVLIPLLLLILLIIVYYFSQNMNSITSFLKNN